MTRNASALLAAALLALACGSSEPEHPSAEQKQQALLRKSMATLEAVPNRIRKEVLKTCDKWKHLEHPCVDADVRTAQLECWLQEGIPALKLNLMRRIGPRTRDLNVMRQHNLCVERRGWRKLKQGVEF